MDELALFAGIGGGVLGGLMSGFRTVCAVEKEPYCREVLLRRQRDGVLPLFPIWDDIRTFDGRPWRGTVDVVTAGFPCQPYSCAGKRRAHEDERNLWPDTIRVIREVGPDFAFLENVPQLINYDYFGEVLGSLAEAGFDSEWGIVSAAAVGAWHQRDRLWILAYAHGAWELQQEWERKERQRIGGCSPWVAHTDRIRVPVSDEQVLGDQAPRPPYSLHDGSGESLANAIKLTSEAREPEPELRRWDADLARSDWWSTEPDVGRVVHGLPHRVGRIAALGNAQVPRVAWAAYRLLRDRMNGGKT